MGLKKNCQFGKIFFIPAFLKEDTMAIWDLHWKPELAEWDAKPGKFVSKSLTSRSCLPEER